MAENEMREGCVVRFENINNEIKDIKKRIDLYGENQQRTREELVLNNANTERLADTLEKIEVTMGGFQKTNEEIQKNLYHLNEGYQRLENGQMVMAEEFNKKIDELKKEAKESENGDITNKLVDSLFDDKKVKREIKLIDRKELWAVFGMLIMGIGAILVEFLK